MAMFKLVIWIILAMPALFIACLLAAPFIVLCFKLGERDVVNDLADRIGLKIKQKLIIWVESS